MFVDHSGRRRRFVVAFGAACGVALILAAVVLVLGLTGAGPARIPGWPEGAPGRSSPTPVTAPEKPPAPSDKSSRPPSEHPAASATPATQPSDATRSTGNGNGNGNKSSHAPTTHPSKGH